MLFIMIVVTITGIFIVINNLLIYILMFLPLDILLEYWIEHVSFGLLYVMYLFYREFQALQLIVLVAFGVVD